MARKKMDEESGGNWMDTYGDMVTLLLTFFVMLYSTATVKEDKWLELVRAFNTNTTTKVDQLVLLTDDKTGEELPGNSGDGDGVIPRPSDPGKDQTGYNNLYQILSKYINEHGMDGSIDITEGPDNKDSDYGQKNIYLTFKDNILFLPDKSTLRGESVDTMAFLGDCVKEVEDEVRLIIVKGHTAKSNTSLVDSRILSAERASTISNFLEDECNISAQLLIPLGLASLYPIATNDTEEGRTLNRRVEIVIVGKDTELGKSEDILNVLGANYTTETADVNELTE